MMMGCSTSFDTVGIEVPFTAVTITAPFWLRTIDAVRHGSLPAIYNKMKETGRWDSLKLHWKQGDPNPPHRFWDSDIAKWIEAACYFLALEPDPALAHLVEEAVDNIRGAQHEDGYLNTYFTVVEPGKRWTNIAWSHEMYNAGHLLEAGVAHHIYTHSMRLLGPILKYVEHIRTVFGPADDQQPGYPGHQELELALLKAYEHLSPLSSPSTARPFAAADDPLPLLTLASFFINTRGTRSLSGEHYFDAEARRRNDLRPNTGPGPRDAERWSYHQAHKPIREIAEEGEVCGHAVRAMYWLTGAAHLARLTRDEGLLDAVERLWESATRRKMYVTGGLGAEPEWEGFGPDYYLPNESGYLESCASIGLVFLAHQLILINPRPTHTPDRSRHAASPTPLTPADVLELALHNAVLASVALDGRSFFYENPPATIGRHLGRSEWFDVACCPANIARLVGPLGRYIYTLGADDTIFVHLYISSTARLVLSDGQAIELNMNADGPWDGGARLVARRLQSGARDEKTKKKMAVRVNLRKPLGAENFEVRVRGKKVVSRDPQAVVVDLGFSDQSENSHSNQTADSPRNTLIVKFTYKPRILRPHPLDFCNRDCVALARGPFVYCVESTDLPADIDLRALRLTWDALSAVRERVDESRFAAWGVRPVVLELQANVLGGKREVQLTLIPMFLWANRGKSDLRIWLPVSES